MTDMQQRYVFEIGGEQILELKPEDDENFKEKLEDIRIRIGSLLKTENVSFLLGAGASVNCGGVLIGKVPVEIETKLYKKGISSDQVEKWLEAFYLAVRNVSGDPSVPTNPQQILERKSKIEEFLAEQADKKTTEGKENEDIRLPANYEQVLALLYRWRNVIPEGANRLQIDSEPRVEITKENIEICIKHATHALATTCNLPLKEKRDCLSVFVSFLRKILTRPLNLKRVNIFTLNYDTLVEQAADAEGIVLLDGFVGTQQRVFRPESYEQDLYFPAETTEGRVHRYDRVVHLYKLHGSITWVAEEPSLHNPYGVASVPFHSNNTKRRLLIYPTPAKYGETLGMPYAEIFRRFANNIVRPQSVLFTIGYGFGDEHVNTIIRQALAIPSFTLIIVDPNPSNSFVQTLIKQKDLRVWLAKEELGKFSNFVDIVLPDLRDESLRRQIIKTQRALSLTESENTEDNNGH